MIEVSEVTAVITKIDLAAALRIAAHYGLHEGICNHFSLAISDDTFLLNPQGRIQGDLYVYNLGDHLMVDTELWQKPKILELFDKYIIMDDVEVADVSDKLTAVAVQGP